MLKTLAFVVALALPMTAHGQDLPRFEFRGHTMGEEASKAFPYYKLDQGTCYKNTFTGRKIDTTKCPADIESQVSCHDDRYDPIINCYDIPIYRGGVIAGVPIYELKYSIYEDKVYSMSLKFEPKQYAKISEMLIGKYGEPARSLTPEVQNGFGAKFTNVVLEWDFSGGTLVATMYDGSTEMSLVMYREKSVSDAIAAIHVKSAQDAGRGAF